MSREKTLFGYIGNVVKQIADSQKADGGSPVATQADVREIIAEMVNKNYINAVQATSLAPTTATLGGKNFVFANGTPITIKEREDGVEGALIIWNGGELQVEANVNVFGGRHDDETLTNTSVTIEGGTVNYIFGGGLHKSHTVKATVVMTGGKVKNLRAGAADQLISSCTCGNHNFNDGENSNNSWAIVDEATMIIIGGEVTDIVFGGGNGYSYTGKVTTTIGEGANIPGYVVVGGANGHTDTGVMNINGGVINTILGINRGTMETIEINVNGGEISKLFAGGEVPFVGTPEAPNANDASGKFISSIVTINAGVIGEISAGGNNYVAIADDDPCVTIVDNR